MATRSGKERKETRDLHFTSAEQPEHLPSRRIHLIGMGSIGTFIAHTLMSLPNRPPISLLFHRREMYDDFQACSRKIRIINKKSQTNDEQSGYDVDVATRGFESDTILWRHYSYWRPGSEDSVTPPSNDEIMQTREVRIYTLLVTVKGPATVMALRSVKHRISAETTICLMQNGMGQMEELNREVFTDPETRPTYMLAVLSHGVFMSRPFVAHHVGLGSTAIGVVRDLDKFPLPPKAPPISFSYGDKKWRSPTDDDLYSNITARYLVRTLTRSPILVCAAFPYLDLLQLQLEKLAVNCVINPTTALLNIPNGNLFHNQSLAMVSRLLLAEISAVIRSLPELEGIPNVSTRFSAQRLENLYLGILGRTAHNSSSMREDIRNGKDTEADYINGYIVRRGEERGLKCVLNYMIMHLVKGKSWDSTYATRKAIPYGLGEMDLSETDPSKDDAHPTSSSYGVADDGPISLEDRGTLR